MTPNFSLAGRSRDAAKAIKRALQPNFYRLHLSYFICVILVSSAILHGSNTRGFSLRFIDALFLASSALCGVGLNSIDLGILNGFQQATIFVLMLMGDLTIITQSVIWIRRFFFRKKLKELLQHSQAAEDIAQHISRDQESGQRNNVNGHEPVANPESALYKKDSPKREASNHRRSGSDEPLMSDWHYSGYGSFPAPWHSDFFRPLKQRFRRKSKAHPSEHHYLSFEPNLDHRGRFSNLTSAQEAELGGVEYRALVLLTWLLPCYALFWIVLVWVILTPYAAHSHIADIVRDAQPGSLDPSWWAIFTTVSSYTNCGLTLLNQSFIPMADQYAVLVLSGVGVLAGNAFYPVFLRLAVWSIWKAVPRESQLHHTCTFLLHHPRRCYLFLFPSSTTWVLFFVQTGITLLSWVLWIVLQLDYGPITHHFPPGQRVMDGLFQSVGLRASGFYIIVIGNITPALQIYFLIVMYISVFPVLLSIRSSNIYEERSLGQPSSASQPDNNGGSRNGHGGLSQHVRQQLAYDIWWLLLAIFLVCIIERSSLTTPAPGWTIYSVIFEVVSAYGTIGFSLGLPYADYSFSGSWHTLSKLILMTVMIRGRHRILPMAIDRAVMVPGEELMEKLDKDFREHNVDRDRWKRDEEEVRREETGASVEENAHGRTQ